MITQALILIAVVVYFGYLTYRKFVPYIPGEGETDWSRLILIVCPILVLVVANWPSAGKTSTIGNLLILLTINIGIGLGAFYIFSRNVTYIETSGE